MLFTDEQRDELARVRRDAQTVANGADPSPTENLKARIVTVREFAEVDEPGADPLVGEPRQVVIPEGGDAMLYGDGGASKTP